MKQILATGIVCLCYCTANAQDVSTALPARFIHYAKENRQEKVFVHTDKSFYLAGEILWFKVYDVDGNQHLPSVQSKVAYIEILDKENKPVMQAKIPLQMGKGNGSFYLPVSISSGNYRLRAYTNWMKNFSTDCFFEKPVTIVNSLKVLTQPHADTGVHYYAGFFPEGGNLVSNVANKVAFEVTDQFGKGMDCRGVVLSEKNDTILRFQSLKFGMGHFVFTPSPAQHYRAFITLANGRNIIQELPVVYEQGYVMQLRDEDAGSLIITVTGKGVAAQYVSLFIHARQEVQATEKQVLSNGVATFTIDKNKLADGISNITVFNEAQQPVCERLYFKKPAQVLNVSANSNATQYGLRKRVALAVQTKIAGIQNNNPANLSLAVYRLDSLQTIDAGSILSYLWLTSDLKGNIESPEYYFSDNTSEVKEATDNLMLVHGWRRFNWDDSKQQTTCF